MAEIQEVNIGISKKDTMNCLIMMQKCLDERKELMDKGFNELRGVINKRFDESNEKWERDRCKLELQQCR